MLPDTEFNNSTPATTPKEKSATRSVVAGKKPKNGPLKIKVAAKYDSEVYQDRAFIP